MLWKQWDTPIKKTLHASEQQREDVVEARKQWKAEQPKVESRRLVFIDESGAKTNMTRLYGRALKGKRANDYAPHGHFCTTTMISSIRHDGKTECMTIEGSTTAEVFRSYVEKFLVPTLKPGDIVVMDNLSSHKDKTAQKLIEEVGAQVRFLPPYSPDLNPIEKMWSKVKSILRSIKARTNETLFDAIGFALKCVTPQDAIGWFNSCGYNFL